MLATVKRLLLGIYASDNIFPTDFPSLSSQANKFNRIGRPQPSPQCTIRSALVPLPIDPDREPNGQNAQLRGHWALFEWTRPRSWSSVARSTMRVSCLASRRSPHRAGARHCSPLLFDLAWHLD